MTMEFLDRMWFSIFHPLVFKSIVSYKAIIIMHYILDQVSATKSNHQFIPPNWKGYVVKHNYAN